MKSKFLRCSSLLLVFLLFGCTNIQTNTEQQQSTITTETTTESSTTGLPTASPELPTAGSGLPTASQITIAVGGDVHLYGRIADAYHKDGADAVINPKVAKTFKDADIAILNYEAACSDGGTPAKNKTYTFNTSPDDLILLSETMGIDVVSLANNHSLDYGETALFNTLENLKNYNISSIGAGENIAEAAEPYVTEIDGQTVAILSASRILPSEDWHASEKNSGILSAYDSTEIVNAVKLAKSQYDYVITYIHWGLEHTTKLDHTQTTLAHELAGAGADAIIGAHPHTIQGFEVYNNVPIAYSLGNLIFYSANEDTASLLLTLKDGDVTMKVLPYNMQNRVPYPATNSKALLQKWATYNPKGYLKENGFVTNK